MPDASTLDTFVAVNVDVHDGDLVVIAGAGEFVDIEDTQTKEKRTRLRIPITCPEGQTKDLTLNETSRKSLIQGYGKNTEDWVKKNALVSIVAKDVFGQIKKVIYLSPVR